MAGAAFLLHEPNEMLEVFRPGAHDLSAHVEHVGRIARRISDAEARPAAAVDENVVDAFARKLRRNHRPGKSATDDRDRQTPVRFHSPAIASGLAAPDLRFPMMVVKADDLLAGGLCEPSWHNRVNDAGAGRTDQLGPDLDGAGAMAGPAIPSERGCSVKRFPAACFSLFYSHCPFRAVNQIGGPGRNSNLRPAV